MYLTVKWRVRYNGERIGGYAQAKPSYRARRPGETYGDWIDGPTQSLWYVSAYAEINEILEYVVSDPSVWFSLQVGEDIPDCEFYQQNRVQIRNYNGQWQTFDLSEHHFKFVKASDSAFRFVSLD